MGTRALLHIHDGGFDDAILTTIYKQFDGYPDGLGNEVFAALGEKSVVNGYSDPSKQVNGMGCAAAMLIGQLKEGCGNVYIYPAGSADCWEEYVYDLAKSDQDLMFRVTAKYGDEKVLYEGKLAEFEVPEE